eukprot:5921074-Lingulodinium_polyedra.AAC.1
MYVIQDDKAQSLLALQDELLRHPGQDEASRQATTSQMGGLVHHHVAVPVCLGLGETGVLQKFVALLHALRLEAPGWATVHRIVNRIVSITTDYGQESILQQAPAMDANRLFPHWDETAQMVDDVIGAEVTDPSAAFISFSSSLPVPGC